MARTLTDADLERLADLVADRLATRLAPAAPAALVDAAQLARLLGVSRTYVYDHAGELGAVRIGTGPKARLRFDVERARATLEPLSPPPVAEPPAPPRRLRARPRPATFPPVRAAHDLAGGDRRSAP